MHFRHQRTDKKKKQFNNISEITCERISKVINGYTDSKGKQVEGLGSTFKVLELKDENVVDEETFAGEFEDMGRFKG